MLNADLKRLFRLIAATLPFVVLVAAENLGLWIFYIVLIWLGSAMGEATGGGTASIFVYGWLGALMATIAMAILTIWSRVSRRYRFDFPFFMALARLLPLRWFSLNGQNVDEVRDALAERIHSAGEAGRLDALTSGTLRDIVRLSGGLSAYLVFPGFRGFAILAGRLLEYAAARHASGIFVYALTFRPEQTVAGIRQGLALYAENSRMLVSRAAIDFSSSWGIVLLLYLLLRGPIGGLFYLMPFSSQSFAPVATLALCLALRHCLVEPILIAARSDNFMRMLEGKVPSPSRERQLSAQSEHYRAIDVAEFQRHFV